MIGSLNMDVVAVAATAKLGGKTDMLGRSGDDDFGRRMRDNVAMDVNGDTLTWSK